MSEIIGAEVWLKFENLQFTAAYKERGALNKLLQLTPEERRARRHRGVGRQPCAGGRLPCEAPRHPGDDRHAEVDADGEGDADRRPRRDGGSLRRDVDDAFAKARELALEKGYVFIHPFDDPQIIAGAGTVGLEMLEDAPDLDRSWSRSAAAASCRRLDRRALGEARYRADRRRGRALSVDEMRDPGLPDAAGGDTLAEGIAVKQPGELTSRILKEYANDVVLVSERDLERAVSMLVGIEKTVVEGAGAAGLAAMLA